MKNLFLIPNLEKKASLSAAERLVSHSEALGGRSSIFLPSADKPYPTPSDVPAGTELIVALGGDGTVIRAAGSLFSLNLPILGINTGSVGFLTGIEKEDEEEILRILEAEEYRVEERLLLSVEVWRDSEKIMESCAFNDAVLRTTDPGRALEWSLLVDGNEAVHYVGDGMIIASPTGSTAYNLSAGGPILYPTDELILATPLNPHSFLSRSIVLPARALVSLRLSGNRNNGGGLYCDGVCFPGLRAGDEVRVTAPERKVRLLFLHRMDFFETLKKKIAL